MKRWTERRRRARAGVISLSFNAMENNNNNNYNNPNIVLAERNRLRALEREARIRRFALEQRRQRQEEDVMDQPPGARALQATATDRLGYLRRRIRIGIQNVANRGRNEEERRDHERAPNLPERVQEDDEPPQCRICMSDVNDENSELGKLFSPCMCKGSVGLVHRKCLDRWRTLSSNPRSYFSCDQCKYDYNLERTEYAKWLEREELPNVFAVLATFLLALTIGVALRTISFALVQILTFIGNRVLPKTSLASWIRVKGQYYLYVENIFYRSVLWFPPWRPERLRFVVFQNQQQSPARGLGKIFNWQRMIQVFPALPNRLDVLVGGIFTLGTTFFLYHNVTRFRRDFRNHAERVGPSILFLFVGSGGRGLRIPVVVGLAYSYTLSHEFARVKCKELLQKFGEIVMEVSREE